MRKTAILLMMAVALITSKCQQSEKIRYPETKKVNTIDNYFGIEVADHFRWLENDTSEEVATWVEAQNDVTFSYLSKIPYREKIKERLTQIWNYPKYGTPFKDGGFYFFFKNDGLQNQSVLYIQDSLTAEPHVILDPNKLSEDGTIAVNQVNVSNNGKYLAYSISRSGSDWNEIYVLDIATGELLNDKVEWVKFSGIAWQKDGFFYSRYDAPKANQQLKSKNEYHKIYYHKVGTPQANDLLIYENKDFPLRNYRAAVSDDEKFLYIRESESTSGNSLFFKDLTKPWSKITLIAPGFEFDYDVVDNIDDQIIILTNDGSPRKKLVMVDPKNPAKENWKTIIPEKEDVLQNATIVGGKLIATYMKDASSRVFVFDTDGQLIRELELPTLGTVSGFTGKKDDNISFYSFTSFIYPSVIYKFDLEKGESTVYFEPEIDFNFDDYETKQVFYTSKDGTKVPMFIVHKKGIKLNGKNPAMLYGYGGFNISRTPDFKISRLIWLENGGVFALANIRGGGEYGEEWHEAGTKLKKQNVFDDFIAAAEYLINEKYTSSKRLAIQGGSNGGLLVGACMIQRPDLFKVALPAVGVMDMLRYHKFTIGWAWATDYGSSEDSTQFRYLLGYSPLHNLQQGVKYPATLVTTADHDDRVFPAHSFKFIARLQECQRGNAPVMIRIETKAGHGAGKPTSKIIEEAADIYAFTFKNMGIKPVY